MSFFLLTWRFALVRFALPARHVLALPPSREMEALRVEIHEPSWVRDEAIKLPPVYLKP